MRVDREAVAQIYYLKKRTYDIFFDLAVGRTRRTHDSFNEKMVQKKQNNSCSAFNVYAYAETTANLRTSADFFLAAAFLCKMPFDVAWSIFLTAKQTNSVLSAAFESIATFAFFIAVFKAEL